MGWFEYKHYIRQLPIHAGRGHRIFPDYALHYENKPDEEKAKVLIEVKYHMKNYQDVETAFLQAFSYAKLLHEVLVFCCNYHKFNDMKIQRVNIGEIIRELVERRNMSKAEFAKNVGIARQNIEKVVFQKTSLDTNLLCLISEILEYNLFNYYKDCDECNKINYSPLKEVKAVLSIEVEGVKKEQIMKFMFDSND